MQTACLKSYDDDNSTCDNDKNQRIHVDEFKYSKKFASMPAGVVVPVRTQNNHNHKMSQCQKAEVYDDRIPRNEY